MSHYYDFEDDYFEPMRALGLFPKRKPWRTISYANLHNPFEVVSHPGNRGKEKRDPHKAYGCLAQPRLGTWLGDFLRDRLK